MVLLDTHTHMYSRQFDNDRDEMIARAIAAGVEKFFLPSIDSEYAPAMYDLEQKYPDRMFLMMGLHPVHVKPETIEKELAFVAGELSRRKFHAVGEIGVDLYWDKSTLELQKDAFTEQIRLAKKYGLPINIHCRDAFDAVFEVLNRERSPELFGIFHCFTGNKEQAEEAIRCGMKLGIGGVVTFKNGGLDQFLSEIPLEHIVLETDAPYLAPAPHRGKRNESAYVRLVAEKLAEVYGCGLSDIASATTKNARDIYGF